MAWNSAPAVSMNQLPPEVVAPTAMHTWPDLPSNVVAGAWNLSAAVVSASAEGTGDIALDHPTVGVAAAPL